MRHGQGGGDMRATWHEASGRLRARLRGQVARPTAGVPWRGELGSGGRWPPTRDLAATCGSCRSLFNGGGKRGHVARGVMLLSC